MQTEYSRGLLYNKQRWKPGGKPCTGRCIFFMIIMGNRVFSTATQKYVCSSRNVSAGNSSGRNMTIRWKKLYGANGYMNCIGQNQKFRIFPLQDIGPGGVRHPVNLQDYQGILDFKLIPYRNVKWRKMESSDQCILYSYILLLMSEVRCSE